MFHRLPFIKRPIAEFDLGRPRLLRLHRVRGARIQVLSGVVLITFQNVANDVELRYGESVVVPNNGLALLEGFDKCRIRLASSHTDAECLLPTMSRHLAQKEIFPGSWLASWRNLQWR